MNDIISVIVPVYKAEKYLEKCLDSIVGQTYKDLEIILVDDGSPDSSGRICDKYAENDNRIKVIHKKNGGDSSARNAGFKEATGKYITTIDSDDWIELDAYEKMLKKMIENNVDIVRCGFFKDFDDKTLESPFIYPESKKIDLQKNKYDFMDLLANGKTHAGVCYMLIRKEIVDKTNGLCEDIVIGQDLIFEFELLCKSSSLYLYNERFYHYYTNPNSATKSGELCERNVKNLILLYGKICDVLKKNDLLTERLTRPLALNCFYKIYTQLFTSVYYTRRKDIPEYIISNKNLIKVIEDVDKSKLSRCGQGFAYLIERKKKKILYYYCIMIYWLKK